MGLAMCEHLYVVFTLSQPVVSFVQSSQFTDENYFFNSRSHYTKHPWGLDQVKGRLAITGLITYLRVWPNSWNLIMNISSKVLGRSPSNFVLSIFDLLEMWYGRWSRDLCCFCMHGNIRDTPENWGGDAYISGVYRLSGVYGLIFTKFWLWVDPPLASMIPEAQIL